MFYLWGLIWHRNGAVGSQGTTHIENTGHTETHTCDLGELLVITGQVTKASHRFSITNQSTQVPMQLSGEELRLCAFRTPAILIPPGESGFVEVEYELHSTEQKQQRREYLEFTTGLEAPSRMRLNLDCVSQASLSLVPNTGLDRLICQLFGFVFLHVPSPNR